MDESIRGTGAGTVELAHYWSGGDGASALSALKDGFDRQRRDGGLDDTAYEKLRLQTKCRILNEEPPDTWSGWPGGELRAYVDANTVMDITDLWRENDLEDRIRPFVADTVRTDGNYYAIPLSVHRVNDLYLHAAAVERAGVDPASADDPAELVDVLSQVDGDLDGILVPMADPFVVLQLWEVCLLGLADAQTFADVTAGNAAANRDSIRSALDVVADLAALAPDDAIYQSLTAANERFLDGAAPVYPQGDWAGGHFSETPQFEFGSEWDRIAFPGTEGMYDLVVDVVIPSADAERDAVDPFLEYVSSTDAQEEFNRLKGSVPPRKDVSTDGFGAFGRDQIRALDDSTEQPQSITHGLSVTSAQLVDLKSVAAEFISDWDVAQTADRMVAIFDEA